MAAPTIIAASMAAMIRAILAQVFFGLGLSTAGVAVLTGGVFTGDVGSGTVSPVGSVSVMLGSSFMVLSMSKTKLAVKLRSKKDSGGWKSQPPES